MGYLEKKLQAIISTLDTWKYYTGTLQTCTANTGGDDGYGASVAIGKNVKIATVYMSYSYVFSGTGSTATGCIMEGYNIATSAWETVGEINTTAYRPTTINYSATASNTHPDNVYSHIRLYLFGGAYGVSRSGSGYIKSWYAKG